MKIQFSFRIRQAMAVAYVIAEEIETNLQWGRPFGSADRGTTRPVLLAIRQSGEKDIFHFEGGVVVKPHLVDVNSFPGYWSGDNRPMQEWVIVSADVRYYRRDSAGYAGGEKISESWGNKKLLQLKEIRWWHHPHVRDLNIITGVVAIFFNHAAGDGYVEADPRFSQEVFYTLQEEFSYVRLLGGDRERAVKEAEARLVEYYR